MSQIFTLHLAPETIATAAQQLGVAIDELLGIHVEVSVAIVQQSEPYLWLTYRVKLAHQFLADQLDWPIWQQAEVGFRDYLWEQTCLECFIGGTAIKSHEATGYIEINASPSGRYALYKFNDYRTPSTRPPVPLLRADGHRRAYVSWDIDSSEERLPTILELSPSIALSPRTAPTLCSTTFFTPPHCDSYERRFGVPLSQLSNQILSIGTLPIKQIHPCVILRFGNTYLYFAPAHTSPPDFHQRQFWSSFDYNAASAK